MDPADILSPGVAVEAAGGSIYGHLAVRGVEIDPANVGTPGVAREISSPIMVDAVVIRGRVGVGVGTATLVCAQPDPADVFCPGVAFQMVIVDRIPAAVSGVEIDPANVGDIGPFVICINIGRVGDGDHQQG